MDSAEAIGGRNLYIAFGIIVAVGVRYVLGLIGRWLGRRRYKPRVGFWLGFALGLLGLGIMLLILLFTRKPERPTGLIPEPTLNQAQMQAINARFQVQRPTAAAADTRRWGAASDR